jgi:hypothetical protein
MTTPVPAFLQPPWFFLYFGLLWFGVSGVLAYWSGWATLAERFRSDDSVEGDRFRFVSGSMGRRWIPVSYGNCLFVTVTPTGLRLSLFLPFRFLSPPLFLPWSAVESVIQKRILLMGVMTLALKEVWPRIALRGAAGKAVYDACIAARPDLLLPADATNTSPFK